MSDQINETEDYGADFVTMTSDDGTELVMEHVDTIEFNGKVYMAFYPVLIGEEEVDPDSEDFGLVILRQDHEDGEDFLMVIEDEAEQDAVYEEFMRILFDDEEEGE